jgi:hypothetical protein
MKSGLNLLRYPTLERQQRRRRQGRAGLLGAGAGALMAGAALCAMSWQTDTWMAETQTLQARLDERQRKVIAGQQQQAENQKLQLVLAQLSPLQTHQPAWQQFQRGLQEALPQHGLRLQRLQVEAGRIEMYGQAQDTQAIGRAAQSLSERWAVPLSLQSLEADASKAPSVSWAWQAHWPALADASKPTQGGKP